MIITQQLTKTYQTGPVQTTVLKGIDLHIKKAEFVAIMGRSGAGKSTLLYQISLLDTPTSGTIMIDGIDASKLSEKQRTLFRLHHLGYVFQDYAIVPELNALENVAIPLLMKGWRKKYAYEKASQALTQVGLEHRLKNLPSQLSGGEQQRVSIARAIAHDPKIIFADEPTANLDSDTSAIVLDIFLDLHKKGQTIVMVTHEEEYGNFANRIIRMIDGSLVGL